MDQAQASAGDKPRLVLQTADVRVVEYVMPPGTWHRWHRHSEVTDRFWCLEGTIAVEVRDPPRAERLIPGQSLTLAPGLVHRAGNPGDAVGRYLLVQGIGRYDYIAEP
ncbi:MAG: cupin domain-containing protein [Acetobacteraceae bacterium]